MWLIYLVDIFEDNYNIVRDEKQTARCKETEEISIYISLAQFIRKP